MEKKKKKEKKIIIENPTTKKQESELQRVQHLWPGLNKTFDNSIPRNLQLGRLRLGEEEQGKLREAKELTARLERERVGRLLRNDARIHQWQRKLAQEEEESRIKQKELEQFSLQQRKEAVLRQYLISKKQREEEKRSRMAELSKSFTIQPREYLYQQIADRYVHRVLMPSLEERKQTLALRRKLRGGLGAEDLRRHAEEHDAKMKELEAKRIEKVADRRNFELEMEQNQRKFLTPLNERVQEEDFQRRQEAEYRREEQVKLRMKRLEYARQLKQVLKVCKDSEKAEELKLMIARLKHPVRSPRDVRKDYDIKELSKSFTRIPSNSKLPTEHSEQSSKLPYRIPEYQRLILKNFTPSQRTKVPDYLNEHRLHNPPSKHRSGTPDWLPNIKKSEMNLIEKFKYYESNMTFLDEQTKWKELLLETKGGDEQNPELSEAVNEMVIDSIKAKIAMLDNFQFQK